VSIGLVRIVAWEYRLPTSEVTRWSWTAFHDALSTLTEQRFGALRAQSRQHNAAAENFRKSLPR
jgi:hypothetical protein